MIMIVFSLGVFFGISITVLLTSAKTEDLYDEIDKLKKEHKDCEYWYKKYMELKENKNER